MPDCVAAPSFIDLGSLGLRFEPGLWEQKAIAGGGKARRADALLDLFDFVASLALYLRQFRLVLVRRRKAHHFCHPGSQIKVPRDRKQVSIGQFNDVGIPETLAIQRQRIIQFPSNA
jgi:hypothetical protein